MSSPTLSGLRRTSPESLAAANYSRRYREEGAAKVTRNDAVRVAKRAAAAMGLKSSKIALIDQLFAASKPADWTTAGVAPVVWPSNERLARDLGISISTMKHHLNGLVRAGLISYSDGPTYQRRGIRDDEGRMIEGYGIDLSPIAVRYQELSDLVGATAEAAREKKKLSYRRTILRKEIQSLIFSAVEQGLKGDWQHAQARLDMIREIRAIDLEVLRDVVSDLEGLQQELEDGYSDAILDLNLDTTLSKFRPLQTTPGPSNSESSKIQQPRANARESNTRAAYGSMAFETKPEASSPVEQDRKRPRDVLDTDVQFISLGLVRDACPKLTDHAPAAFEDWARLRQAGPQIAEAAGINPQVWREAETVLGGDIAIAALAVTVQKAELGLVAKPGAYLRSLTQRGRDGELHISRSLFGMAQAGYSGTGGLEAEEVKELISFPARGTVSFSRWAEVIRTHAPKPTPDVDMVADAFRRWAREREIDLSSPNIERTLIGFCRKWRLN